MRKELWATVEYDYVTIPLKNQKAKIRRYRDEIDLMIFKPITNAQLIHLITKALESRGIIDAKHEVRQPKVINARQMSQPKTLKEIMDRFFSNFPSKGF